MEKSDALDKLTEVVDGGGLTRLQSGVLGLLVKSGLDNQSQNAIMLLIKDDVNAQIDLLLWLYNNNPTAEEVMNMWVRGYLIAHKEEIEANNPR